MEIITIIQMLNEMLKEHEMEIQISWKVGIPFCVAEGLPLGASLNTKKFNYSILIFSDGRIVSNPWEVPNLFGEKLGVCKHCLKTNIADPNVVKILVDWANGNC